MPQDDHFGHEAGIDAAERVNSVAEFQPAGLHELQHAHYTISNDTHPIVPVLSGRSAGRARCGD